LTSKWSYFLHFIISCSILNFFADWFLILPPLPIQCYFLINNALSSNPFPCSF
jgi:hypothetical protein